MPTPECGMSPVTFPDGIGFYQGGDKNPLSDYTKNRFLTCLSPFTLNLSYAATLYSLLHTHQVVSSTMKLQLESDLLQ